MSAYRRTPRDERRRRLGQNFLRPELADRLVADAAFRGGELVVEVCAGPGPITLALARRAVTVVAVEVDPVWARRLRDLVRQVAPARMQVVEADILSLPLPTRSFRVIGSLPFGQTTSILRHLLDNPTVPLERADVVVQWEVARKRAAVPPSTMLSTRGRRGGSSDSAPGSPPQGSGRFPALTRECWSSPGGVAHSCRWPWHAGMRTSCGRIGLSTERCDDGLSFLSAENPALALHARAWEWLLTVTPGRTPARRFRRATSP
jgi:predicted RNA methylase